MLQEKERRLLIEKYEAEYLMISSRLAQRNNQSLRDYLLADMGPITWLRHGIAVFRMALKFNRLYNLSAGEGIRISDDALALVRAEIQRGAI